MSFFFKRLLFLLILIFTISLSVIDVAAQEKLLILRDENDWHPLEWEEGGQFKGLHMDLVGIAGEMAGFEIEIESYPWSRALLMLEQGQADGLTYVSYCDERNKYLIFDDRNILTEAGFSVLSHRSNPIEYTGSLLSIADRRVGIIKGFVYGESFDNFRHLMDIHEFRNYEILFDNLDAGRIEAVLSSIDDYQSYDLGDARKNNYIIGEPYYEVDSVYIAFSRKRVSPAAVERFAGAMDNLKRSEEYMNLMKLYGR